MMTRRIFDGIVLIGLLMHAGVAIPKMWAKKEVQANNGPFRRLVGGAILSATS